MLHNRNLLYLHVFDPYIRAPFDGKNDPIDLSLISLDLHTDRAIPFVPHPSGASIKISRMAGTVTKADSDIHDEIMLWKKDTVYQYTDYSVQKSGTRLPAFPF